MEVKLKPVSKIEDALEKMNWKGFLKKRQEVNSNFNFKTGIKNKLCTKENELKSFFFF